MSNDKDGTGFLLGLITFVARRSQGAVVIYPVVAWDRKSPEIVELSFVDFCTQYHFVRLCSHQEMVDCFLMLATFRDMQEETSTSAEVKEVSKSKAELDTKHKGEVAKLSNKIEGHIQDLKDKTVAFDKKLKEKGDAIVKCKDKEATLKDEIKTLKDEIKKSKTCADCKAKDNDITALKSDVESIKSENEQLMCEVTELRSSLSEFKKTSPSTFSNTHGNPVNSQLLNQNASANEGGLNAMKGINPMMAMMMMQQQSQATNNMMMSMFMHGASNQ